MFQQGVISSAAEIVLKKKKVARSIQNPYSLHHSKKNQEFKSNELEKQQFYKMVSRETVSQVKDPKPILPCAGYYKPKYESIYPKCLSFAMNKKHSEKKRPILTQQSVDNSFYENTMKKEKIKGYVDLEKQSHRFKQLSTNLEGPHENRFVKVNEPDYWSNKKKVYSFFIDKQPKRGEQLKSLPDRRYDLNYGQVQKKISRIILPFDKYTSHQFKIKRSYTEHEANIEFKTMNNLMNIRLDKQVSRMRNVSDKLPCFMNLHHSRLSLDTVNDKMLEQNCSITIDRKQNFYDYKL